MVGGVQRGFNVVDLIGYPSLVFAQKIPHLASDRLAFTCLGPYTRAIKFLCALMFTGRSFVRGSHRSYTWFCIMNFFRS